MGVGVSREPFSRLKTVQSEEESPCVWTFGMEVGETTKHERDGGRR